MNWRGFRKAALIVAALTVAQALIWLGYRAVEEHRRIAAAPFSVEWVEPRRIAPTIDVETQAGEINRLTPRGRPMLLHFWATWCWPCREELPGLLEATAHLSDRADVVLVSLDEAWGPVRAYFPDGVPTQVVRAPSSAAKVFGVETLPASVLLSGDGRIVGRMDGAREWRSDEAAARLQTWLATR